MLDSMVPRNGGRHEEAFADFDGGPGPNPDGRGEEGGGA